MEQTQTSESSSEGQSPWDPIYLMGVSGCGKSVVGEKLAEKINGGFIDGDDLHPPANKEKMGAGIPLEDEDRYPWFDVIKGAVRAAEQRPVIVACSALKRSYRDTLRADLEKSQFIHLTGNFDLIMERIQQREHEYMPTDLLRSQFETLEEPDEEEGVIEISILGNVEEIVEQICDRMAESTGSQ